MACRTSAPSRCLIAVDSTECGDSISPHSFHSHYRLPLPHEGEWREVLNSDAEIYGGSGKGNSAGVIARGGSAEIVLPPLATVMFEYAG